MRKRRHKKNHEESHERWLVSYADFMTLLFAFFTVLYATSEMNSEKAEQFEKSVKKYFIKMGMMGVGNQGTTAGKSGNKGKNLEQALDSPLNKYQKKSNQASTKLKVETLIEESLSAEEIESSLNDLSEDYIGVRLSILSSKIFAGDSTRLSRDGVKLLKKIGQILKSSNKRIFVEGHSKLQSRSGLIKSSWELAALRSSLIVRYLIKVHGIDSNRLVAMSYGSQKPLYEKGNKRNNRMDFLIVTEDSPI